MKKVQWVMINICTFVLMALFIFLPMFKLYSPENAIVFEEKTVYGYHFLAGLIDETQILSSKVLGFVPLLMLLSIFAIDKLSKVEIGKDLINFLCLLLCFVYIISLPLTASNFLDQAYYGYLDFKIIWGWTVILIIVSLAMLYYLIVFIANYVKLKKQSVEQANQ